jgi:hypothetical protein
MLNLFVKKKASVWSAIPTMHQDVRGFPCFTGSELNGYLADWVIWQCSYVIRILQEFRKTAVDLVSQWAYIPLAWCFWTSGITIESFATSCYYMCIRVHVISFFFFIKVHVISYVYWNYYNANNCHGLSPNFRNNSEMVVKLYPTSLDTNNSTSLFTYKNFLELFKWIFLLNCHTCIVDVIVSILTSFKMLYWSPFIKLK